MSLSTLADVALARECFAELFVNIALAGVCTFVTKKASFGCSDSSFRVTLNVGGVFCFSFFFLFSGLPFI